MSIPEHADYAALNVMPDVMPGLPLGLPSVATAVTTLDGVAPSKRKVRTAGNPLRVPPAAGAADGVLAVVHLEAVRREVIEAFFEVGGQYRRTVRPVVHRRGGPPPVGNPGARLGGPSFTPSRKARGSGCEAELVEVGLRRFSA